MLKPVSSIKTHRFHQCLFLLIALDFGCTSVFVLIQTQLSKQHILLPKNFVRIALAVLGLFADRTRRRIQKPIPQKFKLGYRIIINSRPARFWAKFTNQLNRVCYVYRKPCIKSPASINSTVFQALKIRENVHSIS